MKAFVWPLLPSALALLTCLAGGCGALAPGYPTLAPGEQSVAGPREVDGPRQVAFFSQTPEAKEQSQQADVLHPPRRVQPAPPAPSTSPFAGLTELSAEALVQAVVVRNPSLTQMVATWEAASARYQQVTSLEDPMFGAQVGPAAFGSNSVEGGFRFDISQKFPWPGKLALRGENAQAEAHAARDMVEDTRLQLVESARMAFADFYLAARALEVNEENLKLLREFRENAQTRYRTGLVPQQDILQTDVELGRQQERKLTLERMHRVAIARINTLLHLPPDLPLPPPPKEVALAERLPPPEQLRQAALARRPDLKALADHLVAEKAALGLAHLEYQPDFEVMAAYDTFWQEKPLRAQIGVRVNLPVRLARRDAAVTEAQGRIVQRQAELARQVDQVHFEVQQAFEQVLESERTVRLYEKTILPAARDNVEAARSAYATGKVPFLSLIEAQRNRVGLRDRYYESLADYYRRRATLERVVGGPLAPGEAPKPPRAAPARRGAD